MLIIKCGMERSDSPTTVLLLFSSQHAPTRKHGYFAVDIVMELRHRKEVGHLVTLGL